mmetsp:Transcript_31705/g.106811  ORF Transcript_31705/g.106811 Transcript_31705/m.106811 type:complete len:202 (+) Transcript_31705:287-892(+)
MIKSNGAPAVISSRSAFAPWADQENSRTSTRAPPAAKLDSTLRSSKLTRLSCSVSTTRPAPRRAQTMPGTPRPQPSSITVVSAPNGTSGGCASMAASTSLTAARQRTVPAHEAPEKMGSIASGVIRCDISSGATRSPPSASVMRIWKFVWQMTRPCGSVHSWPSITSRFACDSAGSSVSISAILPSMQAVEAGGSVTVRVP